LRDSPAAVATYSTEVDEAASIAIRVSNERPARVVGHHEPRRGDGEGTIEQHLQFVFGQRLQDIDAARDNSAPLTSNDGFSVVAPMNVTSPCSTYGRNASCCALLKRWNFVDEQDRVPSRLRERGFGARDGVADVLDSRTAPPRAR
jgi:hypothetical protein